MSIPELLSKRWRAQGIILFLAFILILCSFLQILPIAYSYRVLLFLTGVTILVLEVYLIGTEEKILAKLGVPLEEVPKRRKTWEFSQILSTGLCASLYSMFALGFFTIGLFYPESSWISWFILPPIIGLFYGYLIDSFKNVVIIILVAYLLVIAEALILYTIPFWEAYRSCFIHLANTFFAEMDSPYAVVLATASYLSWQVPLGFLAAGVGAYIKEWLNN